MFFFFDMENTKPIAGNKGEWSEIYALFRMLGEGKIHAGDAGLNKLDLYYPILNVIRNESKRYEYKPNIEQNVVVIDEDGNEFLRISMDRFMSESAKLLTNIRKGGNASFSIPETESFMREVGCSKIKAPSDDKADIRIVIHDLRTNMTPELGFSIKSQLGSPSTLLNASKVTNITYRIEGCHFTSSEIAQINNIKEHLPRFQAIAERGAKLVYHDIENQIFKNNLLFLDSCMPQFIASCLVFDSLPDTSPEIKGIVERVAEVNPLGFQGKDVASFYEHKMKVLLIDAALGMMPSKEWKGRYDANGGYIVVKKDGDIVCYHFYNRNDVEDFLYYNTRFERADRKRHDYGYLYKGDDGEVYVKLYLQIRFKK